MKYMTFNSSCSYAGVANLLSFYGIDTEDRTIALTMGLPFFFDCEDGCYCSGPMLQGAKWFNLYLKPIGYTMAETEVGREQICEALRSLQYAMLGLRVGEGNKHTVVYTGLKDGKFCMINNRWEREDAPDTLLLSEQELIQRLDDVVTVAVLHETACETVETERLAEHAIAVLQSLAQDIAAFCSREQSAVEIRRAMNTLFRAILLDGITMLDLIGETEISQKLKVVQGQLMSAVREERPLQLDQRMDIPLLQSAMAEYISLIRTHLETDVVENVKHITLNPADRLHR